MASLYYVENAGCDDSTYGLVEIPDEHFPAFKTFIENLNKNSTYGCQPTISVYKIDRSYIRPYDEENDYVWRKLYFEGCVYALKESRWNTAAELVI